MMKYLKQRRKLWGRIRVKTLEVRTTEKNDVMVVYVEGYLNSLLGEKLEEVVAAKLGEGYLKFIINFKSTRMINSVGISIVIGLVEAASEKGATICFTDLSRVNREIFEITGLSDRVTIFDTERDAFEMMSPVA